MHRRKPGFDPLKFTPSVIHNKIYIDKTDLIRYFEEHTLKECAEKHRCSQATIKRKLRSWGIDTSKHNQSEIAKSKSAIKNSKRKPTENDLKDLYITQNIDTKSIAEMYGLHYQTIRNLVSKYGLIKNNKDVNKSMRSRHLLLHGVDHPSQRHDVLKKTSISLNKVRYNDINLKSITELGYYLYLEEVSAKFHYEEMRVPYVDMLSGKRRVYVIDFTVEFSDGSIHWIEVKPDNRMIPEDKRIYASRRAEEAGVIYRGLTESERKRSWELISEGKNFDKVEFLYRTPRSTSKKITYYFKNQIDAASFNIDGWKHFTKPKNNGALWKLILVRQ